MYALAGVNANEIYHIFVSKMKSLTPEEKAEVFRRLGLSFFSK